MGRMVLMTKAIEDDGEDEYGDGDEDGGDDSHH